MTGRVFVPMLACKLPPGTSFVVLVSQATQVDIQKSPSAPPNQSPLTLDQLAFLRGDADAMEKQVAAGPSFAF
jgi:hypothetical protein